MNVEVFQKDAVFKEHSLLKGHWLRTIGYFKNLKRIARKAQNRNQNLVTHKYKSIYSPTNAEWILSRRKRRDYFFHRGRVIQTHGWYLMSAYHDALYKWIQQSKAQTVLEVGSGRGQNLVMLGLRDPSLQLKGLEYSAEGVANSRELAVSPPEEFLKIVGRDLEITAPSSPKIEFIQGSAFEMPFADQSIDVSFTCLVLEQMPDCFRKAVKEMHRVTRGLCLFLEPFQDVNDHFGMQHLRAVDYFRFKASEIEKLGFEIVTLESNFPQKLRFNSGLLVARPKR